MNDGVAGPSLGEELLGSLIDDAHFVAPEGVVELVAAKLQALGGSDVVIYLQDYDQRLLTPLAAEAGCPAAADEPIEGSVAGRAFQSIEPVEIDADGGRRLWVPLLDGSDRVGVLAVTLASVDDDLRRLLGRFAGLVSDLVVTKSHYGDVFFRTRRRRAMSLAAEMQWHLLPPLTLTTPRVSVAGVVEPSYHVGGDAFDYALNGDELHVAIVDAMGHGLDASLMAHVAVGSYRHSRRLGVDLDAKYGRMDEAVSSLFGVERFVTVQMARLDLDTGQLQWVNAGHPPPLLVRKRRVLGSLEGAGTLPVGFGGATPEVNHVSLEPGDCLLFFTDGVVESRSSTGDPYGDDRLSAALEREMVDGRLLPETARRLSHGVLDFHKGEPADDATMVLLQWHGGG